MTVLLVYMRARGGAAGVHAVRIRHAAAMLEILGGSRVPPFREMRQPNGGRRTHGRGRVETTRPRVDVTTRGGCVSR